MRIGKMNCRFLFTSIVLLVFSCSAQRAFAGWPIGKYRYILVPSFNYYTSTNSWDKNGNKFIAPPESGFRSYSFGLYGGYGITRRLDLMMNLPISYQTNKYAGVSNSKSGAGDMLLGLSYNLVNFDYVSFLSVQVSGIAPLYKNTEQPYLGFGSFGTEVKMMYSGSFQKKFLKNCYYNTEIGYRRYFDNQGPDQVNYTATLGVPLTKKDQVSVEVGGQASFSSNKTFNPANISVNRDFAFTKVSLSYGHSITRHFSVFASGFYTVTGRNAGIGTGGSIFTVIKF